MGIKRLIGDEKMVINYVALSEWGLVPALGVIFSITITTAHKIFYSKLLNNETALEIKVRKDVINRMNKFNEEDNHEPQDEKELSNDLIRIVEFKRMIEEIKRYFTRDLLISAILTLVLGVIFIVSEENKKGLLILGTIAGAYHLISWNYLRERWEKIDRFLKGENPKKILGKTFSLVFEK